MRFGEPTTAAAILVACAIAGRASADELRIYSYDPADAATRQAAGALTFTFRKGLLRNTLIDVKSTEATATADLRRVDYGVLGRGGLVRLVGEKAPERDLYEVGHNDEGDALIAAFCPGSKRAWMAFGALKLDRDLTVRVIGDQAEGKPAKLCRTLQFTFHGEWRLPPGRAIDPRSLERRRFPG